MAIINRIISPPNLPVAPTDYQQRYMNQYSSVIRLFHNQVSSAVSAPLPVGSFYDTTTQTNPVANAVNLMKFNSIYLDNAAQYGVQKTTDKIYISQTGIYNIQFSAQLDKTGGGNTSVYIWMRKNGTDIPYSASKMVIAGPNDEKVAAWNWILTLIESDYIELAWSSPDTNTVILAAAPSGAVPGIPSVIVTVAWVSNIIL